jgi:uncharacterized protein
MTLIDRYNNEIQSLCTQYKVKKLYAFGSVLHEGFNNASDVDLIVDFENLSIEEYADNYFALKFALESILNRSVDLLEEKEIKNPFFKKAVHEQRQLIYGH